ncbi:BT4734/BF3469 family protein [Bacteroides sp. CR5/BHMF/2]|nr:BT4734/BF3469 family protein [Bacteroides sp. CR5/BHMF/2]
MENIVITTYRGLSLVSGNISIRQLFEFIRGDVYRDRIRRLREAMEAGDTAKADRMKKQLPYHTITATYVKERLAYSLDKYQDIITVDCDDMPAEKLPEFRQLANDCPDTLGSFISPRMHGLKIFVYLTGKEAEALRAELNALGTVDFPTLERYHHRMYALASSKYETLLNTKVDTSGSDPGRGFFVSHDPDAFFAPERLENVKPLTVKVTLPTEEECKNKKRKNPAKRSPSFPCRRTRRPSTCKCNSTSGKRWNTPNAKNVWRQATGTISSIVWATSVTVGISRKRKPSVWHTAISANSRF